MGEQFGVTSWRVRVEQAFERFERVARNTLEKLF